jgi:hypothetical protein
VRVWERAENARERCGGFLRRGKRFETASADDSGDFICEGVCWLAGELRALLALLGLGLDGD